MYIINVKPTSILKILITIIHTSVLHRASHKRTNIWNRKVENINKHTYIQHYILTCRIHSFDSCSCFAHSGCGDASDVVVVLDSSTSVGEYNFGRLKEYAEHLIREMNKDSCDINLGFLKYSSNAMVQVYLGKYKHYPLFIDTPL